MRKKRRKLKRSSWSLKSVKEAKNLHNLSVRLTTLYRSTWVLTRSEKLLIICETSTLSSGLMIQKSFELLVLVKITTKRQRSSSVITSRLVRNSSVLVTLNPIRRSSGSRQRSKKSNSSRKSYKVAAWRTTTPSRNLNAKRLSIRDSRRTSRDKNSWKLT